MEQEGLSLVCAGLGCLSGEVPPCYIKSENCLENLKDLQRFLRRDHPQSRDVFKQLGKWNTVSQDLIPIITNYRDDIELVINAVKVVVFLTMPVDPSSEDILQQIEYLWVFKQSFVNNEAIAVIITLLEEPLEHLESGTFFEDDWKIVQLVLTLFRNLLDSNEFSSQKNSVSSSNPQFLGIKDELIELFFRENVMDLVLALVHHVAGPRGLLRQDNLLFLELLHHIFWGQRPELIVQASQSSTKEKVPENSSKALRSILEEEKEDLRMLRSKELPRHSRFSGMFVRMSEDGSKKILKRNPFQSPIESVLRAPRFKHGPVKRIACDTHAAFTPKEKVLGLLKAFADNVLAGGYNVLMQSVKEDIRGEKVGFQAGDIIMFFQVAQFFIMYQRYKSSLCKEKEGESDFQRNDEIEVGKSFQGEYCGPIASTMDEDMFTMAVSKWHWFFDSIKETNDWASLSTTGSLMKEMIRMLDVVLKASKDTSKDEGKERRVARILLYKIFYDQTENGILHFLLQLLKSFDIHKQPRSHLADLIETAHVVLRLLEVITKEDGALRVMKKSRKSKKMVKEKAVAPVLANESKTEKSGNEDAGMPGVTANLSTTNSDEIVMSSDSVKDHTVMNTDSLTEKATEKDTDTVPFPEIPGSSVLDFEDEREGEMPSGELDEVKDNDGDKCDDDDDDGDDDDDDKQKKQKHVEVSLDIARCVAIFADNTVVRNYCWLLQYYHSNSPSTTYYIISMLKRICDDCALEPMLYQLSLLRIFYEILSDRKAAKMDQHKYLISFLRKLVGRLSNKLKAQPLLFVEILFWKTRKECHMITVDYLTQQLGMGKGKKAGEKVGISTDYTDNEEATKVVPIRQWSDDEDLDTTEAPIVCTINEKAIAKRRGRGGIFSEEQEMTIKELYEMHKEDPKCCDIIAKTMSGSSVYTPVQVKRRLKQIGLTVLTRKRVKKNDTPMRDSGEEAEPAKKQKEKSKRKKQEKKHTIVEDQSSDDDTLLNELFVKSQKNGMVQSNENSNNIEGSGKEDLLINELKTSRLRRRKKKDIEGSKNDLEYLSDKKQTSEDETLQNILSKKQKNGVAQSNKNSNSTEGVGEEGLLINQLKTSSLTGRRKKKDIEGLEKSREYLSDTEQKSEDETLQTILSKKQNKGMMQSNEKSYNIEGGGEENQLKTSSLARGKKKGIEGLEKNVEYLSDEEQTSDDEALQNLLSKRQKKGTLQTNEYSNSIEGGGEEDQLRTRKKKDIEGSEKSLEYSSDKEKASEDETLQNVFSKIKRPLAKENDPVLGVSNGYDNGNPEDMSEELVEGSEPSNTLSEGLLTTTEDSESKEGNVHRARLKQRGKQREEISYHNSEATLELLADDLEDDLEEDIPESTIQGSGMLSWGGRKRNRVIIEDDDE